jgi:asparagine synthase (glutamine-hydrolysing)
MCNEDGSVWVVYNGQLFDFEPVRDRLEGRGHVFRSRTDTEVLVHLYEEKGCDLLDEVDGMFAFALWDARRRRLLLARDRAGIKPLVYAETPRGLVFASELRALLALPWLPRDVDELGVVRFLYQATVPGEASVIRGIRKLPPVTALSRRAAAHASRGTGPWRRGPRRTACPWRPRPPSWRRGWMPRSGPTSWPTSRWEPSSAAAWTRPRSRAPRCG